MTPEDTWHPECEATSDTSIEVAELLVHRHADGLYGVEAGKTLGYAEQPDLAVLDGGYLHGMSRSHDVQRLGDGWPIVRRVGPRAGAVRREQDVVPHHP
jgi:hypothetical protein